MITTKEECEKSIKGVCEGCGGALSAIETVDNAGRPTFWQGCEHCSSFRIGVELKYFKVARKLACEDHQYLFLKNEKYKNDPDRLAYFLDTETARLSWYVKRIHTLLLLEDGEMDGRS